MFVTFQFDFTSYSFPCKKKHIVFAFSTENLNSYDHSSAVL